jgi:hypothetical protein
MGDDGAAIGHDEAQAMLDAFASVGATHFDVTWTSCAGDKEWFRRSVSLADLTRTLPTMLDSAPQNKRNVIVRPHGLDVTFIQLDDIALPHLARLAPAVFLILETSPGNCQAWVAIRGTADKTFERRLRKGAEADPTASGATRVAGSLNFKDKYAPNFPRVAIRQVNPGRLTTAAELEGLGLVARPAASLPQLQRAPPARSRSGPGTRKWPSYARCVEGAPPNRDKTGPDISRADFVFCMTAISWGWSVDETRMRLMEESRKAQENGEGYAARTARNAATAAERRHRPATPDREQA